MTLCVLATLFVIGLLSVLAENLPSRAKTDADLVAAAACNASSCVTEAKRRGRKWAKKAR